MAMTAGIITRPLRKKVGRFLPLRSGERIEVRGIANDNFHASYYLRGMNVYLGFRVSFILLTSYS
jgi:hypothetical protein